MRIEVYTATEWKRKCGRETNTGRKHSPGAIANMCAAQQKSRQAHPEIGSRASKSLKKFYRENPEALQTQVDKRRGQKRSGQALVNVQKANRDSKKRQKQSETVTGMIRTPEQCENIRRSNQDPENRRKNSEGQRRFYADPKAREKISRDNVQAIIEGRSNYIGSFWSAKTNIKIKYRSELELHWLELLEQMEKVAWFEYESFFIPYEFGDYTHHHVPDLLVTYTDGSQELLEVKYGGRAWYQRNDQEDAKIEAAQVWTAEHGMSYRLVGEAELESN